MERKQANMSVENGALYTPGDTALSTERDELPPSEKEMRKQQQQHFDEYLVKESFVPTSHNVTHRTRQVLVQRKKLKEKSLLGVLCAWVIEHQLGLSINLLLLLGLTHACFPRARRRTSLFFEMSYYHPEEKYYTQGWDDMYPVLFWIVVFTGVRVAVMDYVLKPLARLGGIDSKKAQTRFAEQGWLLIYASIFWTLGMYIMYNSNYWFNLKEMWTGFPTHYMAGTMKWYYLVQFAFWLQQLFVVNIEERRKDHWQMFTHHIFTSALLFTSYGFYQTKVGNVILCMMDVVDILLPFAKLLNYLGMRTPCDIAFGVFITVWFFARHVCYLIVCWSIHADVPKYMPYGCFESRTGKQISTDGGNSIWSNIMQPFNDPAGVVCFNSRIHISFLGLLLALQVLTLIWFGMIIRIAYGVLTGKAPQDVRSDDEVEDEIEEEEVDIDFFDGTNEASLNARPIEEEVDAEGLHLNIRRKSTPPSVRRSSRLSGGRTSAISIPGHGDKKELLGRIGCDKPS